jgi:Cdc6-like AAA superfamily ATPase
MRIISKLFTKKILQRNPVGYKQERDLKSIKDYLSNLDSLEYLAAKVSKHSGDIRVAIQTLKEAVSRILKGRLVRRKKDSVLDR